MFLRADYLRPATRHRGKRCDIYTRNESAGEEFINLEPENSEESTALDVLSKAIYRGALQIVGAEKQSEASPVRGLDDKQSVV